MVAISSRSVLESERVVRPRTLSTNLVSAGFGAGSACGPTDRPRVSGAFCLRGQRPHDLIFGDVIAGARLADAK